MSGAVSGVVSGAVSENIGVSGLSTVSVIGRGYGSESKSVRVRVGGSVCGASDWVSDSSVLCGRVGSGVRGSRGVAVSLGGAVGRNV